MHVGMSSVFQSPKRTVSDHQVYRDELRLADMAEPLGFQSIWGVEHHFTDYTMCPDVVQFLTYMAGRTEKIQLGSMVIVLPWHDPMRVAEEVSMLDNLSDGRMILGIGRGLARVEYGGFRLEMAESRARFIESAEMLLKGLEDGYCEYDGELIKQPRREIRPAPFKSFRGRTYAAAISPESSRIMAELGVGLLIIPQKPWDEVAKELNIYRDVYLAVNQAQAPPPVILGFTFCDEDEDRAREMAHQYVGSYWESVMEHYEFKADHLKDIKGYEYYGGMTEKIVQYGDDVVYGLLRQSPGVGHPGAVLRKGPRHPRTDGQRHFRGVLQLRWDALPEAERSMRLFAAEVMPELQQLAL